MNDLRAVTHVMNMGNQPRRPTAIRRCLLPLVVLLVVVLSSCERDANRELEQGETNESYLITLHELDDLLQPGMASSDVIDLLGEPYSRDPEPDGQTVYSWAFRSGAIRPVVPEADMQVSTIHVRFRDDELTSWMPSSSSTTRSQMRATVRAGSVAITTLRFYAFDENEAPEARDAVSLFPDKVPDLELPKVVLQLCRGADGTSFIAIELAEAQAQQFTNWTSEHVGRTVLMVENVFGNPVAFVKLAEPITERKFRISGTVIWHGSVEEQDSGK